jgi:PST family polysaccharide transporter
MSEVKQGKAAYAQLVNSSSIMGGAAAINMLLGFVRTKVAAIAIGPTGVGLLGSFNAIQLFASTVSSFGIQFSGAREVASASSKGDFDEVGRLLDVIRKACYTSGLLGAALIAIASDWISNLTFESSKHSQEISALGLVVFFTSVKAGNVAVLQGLRQVKELALSNILGASLGTLIAVILLYFYREAGIVPSLIAISMCSALATWLFARRIAIRATSAGWRRTLRSARDLGKLGFVFMWNDLLTTAVLYGTLTLLTRQLGVEATGYFVAAYTLSGLFVSFVLQAMGSDFYPHLAGLQNEHAAMNALVNKQLEIGLLLALPGLVATVILARWEIALLYSKSFYPAIELIIWLVIGSLCRVLSWPLTFLVLALGKGRWFFFSETSLNVIHILLVALGILAFGLVGAAIAFFVSQLIYIPIMIGIAMHLTRFRMDAAAIRIGMICFAILIIAYLSTHGPYASLLAPVVLIVSALFSLLGLGSRLDHEHHIMRLIRRIPGTSNLV